MTMRKEVARTPYKKQKKSPLPFCSIVHIPRILILFRFVIPLTDCQSTKGKYAMFLFSDNSMNTYKFFLPTHYGMYHDAIKELSDVSHNLIKLIVSTIFLQLISYYYIAVIKTKSCQDERGNQSYLSNQYRLRQGILPKQ